MVDLEVAEVEGSREAMGVVEEEQVEVSREPETGSVQTRESGFGLSTHHLLRNLDRKMLQFLLNIITVSKVLSFSFMVINEISLVTECLYIYYIIIIILLLYYFNSQMFWIVICFSISIRFFYTCLSFFSHSSLLRWQCSFVVTGFTISILCHCFGVGKRG